MKMIRTAFDARIQGLLPHDSDRQVSGAYPREAMIAP